MKSFEKTFVLDTNVLVHRPDAFLFFADSEVVIPLWVFEELDRLKKDHSDRGRSAREVVRLINHVAEGRSLQEGIPLKHGGILRVVLDHSQEEIRHLPPTLVDNRIILCALMLKKERPKVFFVSKDINARIKASALGVEAIDYYEKDKVSVDALYSGIHEVCVPNDQSKVLKENGRLPWEGTLNPNEFVFLRAGGSEKTVDIGRYRSESAQLEHVDPFLKPVMGIRALNVRQRAALDLLLDTTVSLVTLLGKAGTGKTLLALAAGLQRTIVQKSYARVLISRPVVPVGRDIGFLPGAKSEKMCHWMQPIMDNLELIVSESKHQNLRSVHQLLNGKVIEVEALTYIRGRSLPRQFLIIDEAQNLTPHEVKTIVSRAGEGTKVVLTGDPFQIDSPYLDESSNGLIYLVEAFKGQEVAGHVTLAKSERSLLAELAANLL